MMLTGLSPLYIDLNVHQQLIYILQTPAKPTDFEELQPSPQKPLAKINFDTGAPKRKGKCY